MNLRRITLAVLVVAPIVSYSIPASTTLGWFTADDIGGDLSGFLSFMFMLVNPYVGMAIVVAMLGRSLTRCSVLLIASILISAAGIFLWYDLLVRDPSVMSFFVLLGVGAVQWWGITAMTVICIIIWAIERGLARRRSAATLLILALLVPGCSDPAPVSEQPPPAPSDGSAATDELTAETIVKGLPWAFTTTMNLSPSTKTTETLFKSVVPIETSAAGDVYLRATLSNRSFDNSQRAAEAFINRCRDAHPDTGLSYAWDLVIQQEKNLLHLHADCLFSEQAFTTMSVNLLDGLDQTAVQILRCRCGSGCETLDLDRF